ncbi:MAG: putative sulfate/molybdate transporter [Desulfofustis sp.]|nr:putative sulfate/molybdate transporter [Desulfofustis sp.]
MSSQLKFSRTEFAGSLGDLGTLLPLSVGLIAINHLDATGIFFTIGLFYIFSAFYFRVTSPVEPMKVISGYAIATAIPAVQIQASCFWVFLILLVLGATGLIDLITKYISKPVVRGVQLSTGILLLSQGIRLMTGTSAVQLAQGSAEPFLLFDTVAGVPIGILLGGALGVLCLFLLDNKRLPAAVVVVGSGMAIGLLFGGTLGGGWADFGFNLPPVLPYGLPTMSDFSFALIVLVLPQIPMTVGNAIIANADLSRQYFQENSARVTHKRLCLSMALANFVSFFLAGFPMCHGAGGLASRYRFGARTGGSNLIIGMVFLLIAILFGTGTLAIVQLIPLSVLGILLVFAGGQLGLSIVDLLTRKELFVILMIVGITLASNLAAGFIAGIAIDRMVRWEKLSI